MATVRWMPQALAELAAIEDYLGMSSLRQAEVFVSGAFAATARLELFPRSGRIVPEVGEETIREIIYRGYPIAYVVDEAGTQVQILTVFHSSREFGTRAPGR